MRQLVVLGSDAFEVVRPLGVVRIDGLRLRRELGSLTSFLLDLHRFLGACLREVVAKTRECWLFLAALICSLVDALGMTLLLTILNCLSFILVDCLSFLDLREVRDTDLDFFFYYFGVLTLSYLLPSIARYSLLEILIGFGFFFNSGSDFSDLAKLFKSRRDPADLGLDLLRPLLELGRGSSR